MKQKQLIFKAGCALVLCASLALPGALAAWDDFQLLHTPSVRPQADGALSYQARELPTAYALYRRRQLSNAYPLEESAKVTAAAEILAEKTRTLQASGVLSDDFCTQAERLLSSMENAVQSRRDGFSFLSSYRVQTPESASCVMQAEWLDDGGTITQYKVMGIACTDDPKTLFTAYRTYLGLDALTDWEPVRSGLFSQGTCAEWSAQGQIYLYCSVSEKGLQIGALSFSENDFLTNRNILETTTE